MRSLVRILFALSCFGLMGGCGGFKFSYTMVHPTTNEVVYCRALDGYLMAWAIAADCTSTYKKQGFVELTTPATLEITTDPSHAVVYSSSDPDTLEATLLTMAPEMGIAPITMNNPVGSYWVPECYKAIYDGRESDIVCREQVETNRRVHLIVKAKQ